MKFLLAGIVALVGVLAVACIGVEEQGVHFRSYRIDFGAPPSRYAMYYGQYAEDVPVWRPGTKYYDESGENADKTRDHEENRMRRLFRLANKAEARADYREALSIWRRCQTYGVGSPGAVRRRIDLLRIIVSHPHLRLVQNLLLSTRPYLAQGEIPDLRLLDPILRQFAMYERALHMKDNQAAAAYRNIAHDFPRSPLAEPALIMVPRTLLQAGCDASAADLAASSEAIKELLTRYPNTRFRLDALGWRARMLYLKGQYSLALLEYRRQFALCSPDVGSKMPLGSIILCETELHRPARVAAAYVLRYGLTHSTMLRYSSITRLESCFASFEAADSKAFWHLLRLDPRLMAYYMDFRLDNTIDLTGLLDLADRNDSSVLRSPFRARFLARAAEAAYKLGRKPLATRYARMALRSNPEDDDAARAEFVLGAVDRRIAKADEAITHFETIIHRYPDSYLRDGARENLAVLYERQGRFGGALDTYRQLNYKYDVAYMLDIRMTPSQIASYLDSHPHLADRDGVVYSLGLRYLRKHDWVRAEKSFKQVSRRERASFRDTKDEYTFDESKQQDPLVSARDLARLDNRIHSARSSNNKAAAIFAMADYYYSHRNLMLYNGFLWEGGRSDAFGFSWNPTIATPQDDDALWTHHWEHECMAQSLLLCRKIVSKYPHAPIRYRAAYMGACAAKRLSKFNPYWRWQSDITNLDSEAARLMKIASRSPNGTLATKARKYAEVFAQGANKKGMFEMRRRSNKFRNEQYEPDGAG